jgi:hypothetical protein
MLGLRSRTKEPPLDTLDSVEERVSTLPKGDPLATLQELAALLDVLLTRSRIAPGQAYPIVDLVDRTGSSARPTDSVWRSMRSAPEARATWVACCPPSRCAPHGPTRPA